MPNVPGEMAWLGVNEKDPKKKLHIRDRQTLIWRPYDNGKYNELLAAGWQLISTADAERSVVEYFNQK